MNPTDRKPEPDKQTAGGMAPTPIPVRYRLRNRRNVQKGEIRKGWYNLCFLRWRANRGRDFAAKPS